MAASPDFKVYFEKEYIAACKHVEDAAALVAFRGKGATIRHGHKVSSIVWTEGSESQPAGESYDHVVEVVQQRIQINRFAADEKRRAEADRIAALHRTGQATLGARRS